MLRIVLIAFIMIYSSGCASTVELSKRVWGSSTRDLEEARVNGIVRIYDATPGRCFDEVVTAVLDSEFTVFIKDKPKLTIVVLGVKGSVNTTKVGVFFSEMADNKTKIYVSSLSSNAKRIVAEKIFFKLDAVLGASGNQAVTVINEQ